MRAHARLWEGAWRGRGVHATATTGLRTLVCAGGSPPTPRQPPYPQAAQAS